jgi:uncharacterized protein YabE (DUF348 family)
VKYGLYGAVLAGLVGGTVAWTTVDKTISLVVDGQATSVHTTASEVGAVLSAAGYHPGEHDILAPSVSSAVHNGSRIVYNRGRLLHLDVNGDRKDVWTTAPTVAAALAQLGYSTTDFTSVSRSQRLPLGATDIAVRTPKLVTVTHDGKTTQASTTDATVGALMHDLGITVGADDQVTPAWDAPITDGAQIVIAKVTRTTVTENQVVPFPTSSTPDPNLLVGQTQIVTPGKNGLAEITYSVVYVDGQLAGKTPVNTVVLKAPVPQVQHTGAMTAPPPPPAPSVTPGSAQDIAHQMMGSRGWGDDQFSCLVTLWNHESSWNVHATNSSSGAYGIPQALPGSKMGGSGPDWQNNATTQITWGLGYIAGRYSTPCGAWSYWQGHGWY